MKYLIGGLCLLLAVTACGNKRQSSLSLTATADSALRNKHLLMADRAVDTSRKDPPADESFEDFIYRLFTGNSFHQDTGESYYTLLFDQEKELEMEVIDEDTFHTAQVEWIALDTRVVKSIRYVKEEGVWLPKDSCRQSIEPTVDSNDFYTFYARFVTDSLYQQSHIAEPLEFITIDPEDELSILETTLEPGQWYAFRPQLPVGRLTNINYGQQNDNRSETKILKVNGIGNGYSVLLYFRKVDGAWELYKFEDTGV
ncbi:MAG: DUF4348 domain-containing protein [Prevotellaceae bacterium]|jgi:hypothetical protein|nr:DUF4348 domain-containing protein [Prevotellaceae bacterium]